jgi:hypothetical protein
LVTGLSPSADWRSTLLTAPNYRQLPRGTIDFHMTWVRVFTATAGGALLIKNDNHITCKLLVVDKSGAYRNKTLVGYPKLNIAA